MRSPAVLDPNRAFASGLVGIMLDHDLGLQKGNAGFNIFRPWGSLPPYPNPEPEVMCLRSGSAILIDMIMTGELES